MNNSGNISAKDYFVKSQSVWFPDFAQVLQSEEIYYAKNSDNFSSLMIVLRFFRKELTRSQFVAQFLEQDAPQKMLTKHRTLYNCAHELCVSYQNQLISNLEFDENLLSVFRNRPTEDAFSPAFELWDEITYLLSAMEKKLKHLPIFFDGFGWCGFLKGNLTRQQYVEAILCCNAADYLNQLAAYGVSSVKDSLADKFSTEVSVCVRLDKLCLEYKNNSLTPDIFDSRFLQLAEEFCSDIA